MPKLGGEHSVWGSDGKRYDPGMDVPASIAKGWSNPDIVWVRQPSAATAAHSTPPPPPGDEAGDDEAGGDKPPARNAAKAEWVDHAVSRGADRAAAEAMNKEQLVAEYGD
jgi:hypothetical protein